MFLEIVLGVLLFFSIVCSQVMHAYMKNKLGECRSKYGRELGCREYYERELRKVGFNDDQMMNVGRAIALIGSSTGKVKNILCVANDNVSEDDFYSHTLMEKKLVEGEVDE